MSIDQETGPTKEEMNQIAFDKFRDCKKILDIGCGRGDFVRRDPERIEGIDWNNESVIACREEGLPVIQKDARYFKMELGRGVYDGIHISHVIEHLVPDDAYAMLNAVDYVLAEKGILVIRTHVMNPHFWNDFSHIKPYSPHAIRHYFLDATPLQRNYPALKGVYDEIDFIWRKLQDAYLISFRKLHHEKP